MLWKPIIVADWQRVVVTRAGRFHRILGPGEHRLFMGRLRPVEIETHSVRGLVFNSFWADFLVKRRPEVVVRHFFRVETRDSQIAMIYADGSLFNVLLPAKRLLLWRGVAEITVEVVDVIDRPEAPKAKLPALQMIGRDPPAKPLVDSREVCCLPYRMPPRSVPFSLATLSSVG